MFRNFLSWLPLSKNSLTVIGLFIVLAAIPLTVFLAQQQQEIRQRAAPGTCRDNPESPPAGYKWKADCNRPCTNNSQCPQNNFDAQNVNPETSNWCYGFEGTTGTSADWRCLMLVRPVCESPGQPQCGGGGEACTLGRQTPDVGDACGNCIVGVRTDLRPFYNQNGHSACSNKQIVNDWCNGLDPAACNALKSGQCAQQCGGIPTPSPTPGATALEVNFKLQQITNPKNLTRQVKVEIFDTGNKVIKSENVTTNFQNGVFKGTLDLGTFTSGSYVVKLKVKNTLRKLVENVTNITAGQKNSLKEVELFSGDLNNDNELNAVDYANLVGCLDIRKGACADKVSADLNDDGTINTQDLAILIFNFSHKQGD